MKTIFITITRGFIVRNILRSGVLEDLKRRGYKTVILFPERGRVPQYLRDEFGDGNQVFIEEVKEVHPRRGYTLFTALSMFLVYSRSTWIYEIIGSSVMIGKPRWYKYLRLFFYYPLQFIPGVKKIARAIEYRYFRTNAYDYLFSKYQPDLIFSTSIVSSFDIAIMKEGRRRGLKTVSMPKGWDNISKGLYRFIPDEMIVQNELMKKDLTYWQGVKKEHITVTGFPQFDWYTNKDVLLSREEFMKSLGFAADNKLIFFGSEGAWTPKDHKIAEAIDQFITDGSIDKNARMLVRPHFSDIHSHRFDYLKGKQNMVVDSHFNSSDFFMDNWDPTLSETKYFVNLVYHADVLVTIASTLSLDCAAYDTPLVNVAYGSLFAREQDRTKDIYETHHSQWVLKTGAVKLVYNHEELCRAINEALLYPEIRRKEREELVRLVCYKVDGQSSKRLVDVIDRVVKS